MSLFHLHFLMTKKEKRRETEGKLVNDLALLAGIIGPVMTMPQVWGIWVGQDASGVAVSTWVTYLVTGVVWLIYGIWHKEKLLIFTYSAWVVMEIAVVAGIVMYG